MSEFTESCIQSFQQAYKSSRLLQVSCPLPMPNRLCKSLTVVKLSNDMRGYKNTKKTFLYSSLFIDFTDNFKRLILLSRGGPKITLIKHFYWHIGCHCNVHVDGKITAHQRHISDRLRVLRVRVFSQSEITHKITGLNIVTNGDFTWSGAQRLTGFQGPLSGSQGSGAKTPYNPPPEAKSLSSYSQQQQVILMRAKFAATFCA